MHSCQTYHTVGCVAIHFVAPYIDLFTLHLRLALHWARYGLLHTYLAQLILLLLERVRALDDHQRLGFRQREALRARGFAQAVHAVPHRGRVLVPPGLHPNLDISALLVLDYARMDGRSAHRALCILNLRNLVCLVLR